MKKFLYLAAATLLMAGCQSDITSEAPTTAQSKGVSVTVADFQPADTRAGFTITDQGLSFSWNAKDWVSFVEDGKTTGKYDWQVVSGAGDKTAMFNGAGSLKGGKTYRAIFPALTTTQANDMYAVPVDFTGQVQNGDNTIDHLSNHLLMVSDATVAAAENAVSFKLKHRTALLRMQITVPTPGTYTSITIAHADGDQFTTQATANLFATNDEDVLTTTATSPTLTLGLNNVTTTEPNQVITAYMVLAPKDFSTSNLKFTLNSDNGAIEYPALAGKNFVAGGAYNMVIKPEEQPEEPTEDIEVDLDLPDGTIWATRNVGAEHSWDYGEYYAWGETVAKKGTYSDWGLGLSKADQKRYSDAYRTVATPDGSKYNSPVFETYYTSRYYSYYGGRVDYNRGYYGPTCSELKTTNDAAYNETENFGHLWRIPTQTQFETLKNGCTWTVTTVHGVKGLQGTSKTNGKTIFLPFAGTYTDETLSQSTTHGAFWTRNLVTDDNTEAFKFGIAESGGNMATIQHDFRYTGLSIRPVKAQ